MLNLKQILKTELYNNADCKIGQVTDLLIDKFTGKCFLRAEGKTYGANNLNVTNQKLTAGSLNETTSLGVGILDKPVYDTDGKFRGTVENVILGKTLTYTKLVCSNGAEFKRGQVYAIGDVVLIKQQKAPAAKKRQTASLTANKPTSSQLPPASNAETTQTADETKTTYPVRRRYGDFSFLIGKTADKNITNFYNEIMLKKGDVVTREILKQAKTFGKLIELCLHVK